MRDGTHIAVRQVLALEHAYGDTIEEAISSRALRLVGALPAKAVSPVIVMDFAPERALALAVAFRWWDVHAHLHTSTANRLPKQLQAAAASAGVHASTAAPNVILGPEGNSVRAGSCVRRLVSPIVRRPWDELAHALCTMPNPDTRWTTQGIELVVSGAHLIVTSLRKVAGDAIRASILGKARGRLSAIAGAAARPAAGIGPDIPVAGTVWCRRMAAAGRPVRADARLCEKVQIAPARKGDTNLFWRSAYCAQVVLDQQAGSHLLLCTSGSMHAVGVVATRGFPFQLCAAPLSLVGTPCDALVIGANAPLVARLLKTMGLSVSVVDVTAHSVRPAQVMVVTDTGMAAADMALAALMSGVIPVLPAGPHSCLWAVASVVAQVTETSDPDELCKLAAGVCHSKSAVYDTWRLRGTEVWARVFGPKAGTI